MTMKLKTKLSNDISEYASCGKGDDTIDGRDNTVMPAPRTGLALLTVVLVWKGFVCEGCGRGFARIGGLEVHQISCIQVGGGSNKKSATNRFSAHCLSPWLLPCLSP